MISLLRGSRAKVFPKVSNFRAMSYFGSLMEREALEKIPYNFKGVQAQVNSVNTQRMYQFLHSVIGDKIGQGFTFAYDAFTEGFENKDLEFFKEIVEPKLYDRIESAFQYCDRKGLTIRQANSQSKKFDVAYSEVGVHCGVQFERRKNPKVKKNIVNVLDYMSFNLYIASSFPSFSPLNQNVLPIMQVSMYISSPRKLVLENTQGEVIAGDDSASSQTHKIVFETDQKESPSAQSKLMSMMSSFSSTANTEKMFKDIFIQKDTLWKISDIDNMLKGNPFDE